MTARDSRPHIRRIITRLLAAVALPIALVVPAQAAEPPADEPSARFEPTVTPASAHDRSPTLASLAETWPGREQPPPAEVPERGPFAPDDGFSGDGAIQDEVPAGAAAASPFANFEGVGSQDNFDVLGIRPNPPDTIGDVGPNHYVQMVNLLFAVYSKTGAELLPPTDLGALWAGFAVDDCTDASGDPVVVYDQFADRWILTQFTTRGLSDPTLPFYNCVAVSTSGDPAGSYYRYAFSTGSNFPDYPKYGVWRNTYVITTREFGPTTEYGIGVYGLQKRQMLQGNPASAISFFIDGNDPVLLPLIGDGLLPADVDGNRKPARGAKVPLVGTQDDDWVYGAASDAANVWEFGVDWRPTPTATLDFAAQLPVAEFDSNFPCGALGSRDCLPQPGIVDPAQFLDILSYRQRPTWRLAYRNFGDHEALVTNQSVEAAPATAGVRWYEFRRTGGTYSVYQQGTYAPADGVHRWMGSIAQDKRGNMALGYSVVNGSTVFPGIRYTGRRTQDPLGQMTLSEGTIAVGTGVQTTTNSRWGDYTSMNIDPDNCTFWYTNEYYTAAGQATSSVAWQTRIASFELPGSACPVVPPG